MPSVLVVDDDAAFLEAVPYALRRKGGADVVIETALGAAEALCLLATRQFDAIVTDFGMPGLNGFDFLKECRRMCPDTPVLLLTGYEKKTLEAEALKYGAYGVLEKPIDPDVLYSAITRCILRSRLMRRSTFAPLQAPNGNLAEQQRRLSESIQCVKQRLQDRAQSAKVSTS